MFTENNLEWVFREGKPGSKAAHIRNGSTLKGLTLRWYINNGHFLKSVLLTIQEGV